jgi:hypothetical protein
MGSPAAYDMPKEGTCMVTGFLLIVGIYGFCIAAVHAVYRYSRSKRENTPPIHLVLVTSNNQSQIEWYLGSFIFFSWLRGRTSQITVFDDSSTDDTRIILHTVALGRGEITIYDTVDGLDAFLLEHEEDSILLLRLDRMDFHKPDSALQW